MKLIFMGPQGSGKGTYASRIAPRFGIIHLATGDLFREEMKEKTELGEEAKTYINKGILVPDEITINILKNRISQEDCKNGFILDGFPRTLTQAEALEGITEINAVINLVVPHEVLIFRLSSRIICRKCAEIYNIRTLKPKKEGICDKCGGELYQREDETPEGIKKRLEEYANKTAPLIDYYRKKGLLYDIECDKADIPPDVIVEKIINKLKEIKQATS